MLVLLLTLVQRAVLAGADSEEEGDCPNLSALLVSIDLDTDLAFM